MTTAQNLREQDITVSVNPAHARTIIMLAGGMPNERGGWNLSGSHYWQTDEALMVAISEIAVSDLGR